MADLGDSLAGVPEKSGPGEADYGIFVQNLPLDTTAEELGAIFVPYGEVRAVFVVRRPEFTSHAHGRVLLDTNDGTKRAIQKLNQTLLRGHTLRMEPTFGRTSHMFHLSEYRRCGAYCASHRISCIA